VAIGAHDDTDGDSPAWTEARRERLSPASASHFIARVKNDTAMSGSQVGGRRRQVVPVSASAPLTGGPHCNCFPTQK
jgi:hypothetical protein